MLHQEVPNREINILILHQNANYMIYIPLITNQLIKDFYTIIITHFPYLISSLKTASDFFCNW